MNDFGTVFGVVVEMPAIAFAAVAASRSELSTFARRGLVIYGALIVIAFASLFAASLGNPVVVYAALGFACLAILSDGPFALGLSAFGLVALLVLGMTQTLPFSPLGPALGLIGCMVGLIIEAKRSRFRMPPRR